LVKSNRRGRQVLLSGCAAAAALLVGCGTPVDDSGAPSDEATVGQDASQNVPATAADDTNAEPGSVPPSTPSDVSNWEELDLGPILGDDFVSLTEHDGEVWLARLVGDRTSIEVRNLAGDRTHRFDATGPPAPPQLRGTPFGLLMISSDYETFVPKSWLSTDGGATWTEGLMTDRPFNVSGLTVVDGHLLAPGAFRPSTNPSAGPFTPGLFRSDDGVTWSEVVLDRAVFDSTDGWVGPIVDQGERLVTTSTGLDGEYVVPVMLESLDRGLTWQIAADTGPAPSGIVAAGRALVGVNSFGSPDAPTHPVATNDSRTWIPLDVTPFVPPFQYASTFHLAGGPQALMSLSVEPTIEYCYEHTDECDHGRPPILLLIDAGGTAVSVDLGVSAGQVASSALVRADGSLAVVTYDADRLVLRSWDIANGPVPVLPTVDLFTPTGPPVAQWDDELEVGQTYRFPLGTHCGIDFLANFNGQHWWIIGAPADAYDPAQLNGSQRILGELTLIDAGTIEYRSEDELIATYGPQPEAPPLCE
jgi:hypothetical protein